VPGLVDADPGPVIPARALRPGPGADAVPAASRNLGPRSVCPRATLVGERVADLADGGSIHVLCSSAAAASH